MAATAEQVARWDSSDLLDWIQKEWPKLLAKADDLDTFRAAEITGDEFIIADEQFFEILGFSKRLGASLALRVRSLRRDDSAAKPMARQAATTQASSGKPRAAVAIPTDPHRTRGPVPTPVQAAVAHVPDVVVCARRLRERIFQTQPPRDALDDPAQRTALPFPSLCRTPDRFRVSGGGYWDYMGREKFKDLLEMVERSRQKSSDGLWLHGTYGYGKSHILAALVCYLIAAGERVIYLPDCRNFAATPFEYVQRAILLAWADDETKIGEVMRLESMNDVSRFLRGTVDCLFVFDQVDALAESEGMDDRAAAKRRSAMECLEGWAALNMCIFGASARYYHTRFRTASEHSRNSGLYVFGGLTATEMQQWWLSNEQLDLGRYDRDAFEDLTGSIPLLLDNCVVDGRLSPAVLADISREVLDSLMSLDRNGTGWSESCQQVISCVFRQTIPADVYPKLFDYRYCYGRPSSSANGMVATYSCGIARDTAARWLQLCDTKGWKRPESPVLRASTLRSSDYIDNPSFTRFFATQAILTSPVVEVSFMDKKLLRTVVFEELPTFELVTGSMLYIPLKCPYSVDGVYVEFYSLEGSEKWKWGCLVRPFVVALGGRASGVEEEFFSQWSDWSRGLEECQVAVTFVWFTPRPTDSMAVGADSLRNRDGTVIKHPAYCSMATSTLSDAASGFWRAYREVHGPPEFEDSGIGCRQQ